MERWLTRWIMNYVDGNPELSSETVKAQKPLRAAQVAVQEVEGNPEKVPFEVAEPAADALSLHQPAPFRANVKRETKATSRTWFTYRHSGSLDSVRAPQIRMPRPGNARRQLTPTMLSRPCSLAVTANSRSCTPSRTSFAGALWMPRRRSLRAHAPATWPHGGTASGRAVSGSITVIHGQ